MKFSKNHHFRQSKVHFNVNFDKKLLIANYLWYLPLEAIWKAR